jgi:serine/threonine-protein kinase
MFLDEARLAARIQHPNVVSVLDVVAAEGELFLVMDYVHGESFATLLKRAQATDIAIPTKIVVGIALDLLYGLHAAHEARSERGDALGIVHRDVSPQNVLVGADGIARVLDFGIAKAAAMRTRAETRSGYIKGKLSYMAPEQVATRQVDRRTDVYAAAVVLWEALTGNRFFPPLEVGALMAQILTRDHVPPSRWNKSLPAGLDEVVLRGLARDPESRYATAHDMAADLERVLSPARPREIGEWVQLVARQSLGARAESMSEVEVATLAEGAQHGAVSSEISATKPANELTLRSKVEWRPPRHDFGRWFMAGVAGVILLGVFAGYATFRAASSFRHETPASLPEARATAASLDAPLPASAVPAPAPVPLEDSPAWPEPFVAQPVPTSGPPPMTSARAFPRRSSPTPQPRNCQPPYTVDSDGVQVLKRWCF